MSKIKLLLDVVSDLKALSESLQAVADVIAVNETESEPKTEQSRTEEPQKEKQITMEEVRSVLAEKSHDGFTSEARGLLEKYGASKLSEIDPSRYSGLLADAKELK